MDWIYLSSSSSALTPHSTSYKLKHHKPLQQDGRMLIICEYLMAVPSLLILLLNFASNGNGVNDKTIARDTSASTNFSLILYFDAANPEGFYLSVR